MVGPGQPQVHLSPPGTRGRSRLDDDIRGVRGCSSRSAANTSSGCRADPGHVRGSGTGRYSPTAGSGPSASASSTATGSATSASPIGARAAASASSVTWTRRVPSGRSVLDGRRGRPRAPGPGGARRRPARPAGGSGRIRRGVPFDPAIRHEPAVVVRFGRPVVVGDGKVGRAPLQPGLEHGLCQRAGHVLGARRFGGPAHPAVSSAPRRPRSSSWPRGRSPDAPAGRPRSPEECGPPRRWSAPPSRSRNRRRNAGSPAPGGRWPARSRPRCRRRCPRAARERIGSCRASR